MPSRRTHQKSRLGCLQCKRRRVKCDEHRPVCSSCTIRGVRCEYATSGSLIWPKQPETTPVAGQRAVDGADVVVSTLRNFGQFISTGCAAMLPIPMPNVRELELMYQFCTSTCRTLSHDEQTQHIWQVVVPREGLTHLYLMHGILAIAALHLARLGPQGQAEPYLSVAVAHQDQAVSLLTPILSAINSANAGAIFALSSLMNAVAFGFLPRAAPQPSLTPIDDINRVFQVTRGLRYVLAASREWLDNSELSVLLKPMEPTPGLPETVRLSVERLRSRNAVCGSLDPNHETNVYMYSIDQIEFVLERIYGGCMRTGLAVLWPMKVPQRYLDLLSRHEPLALAVLAHYCVVLHKITQTWFVQGWSARVLESIWVHLTPEWRPAVFWAMQVTGTSMSEMHSQPVNF